MGKLELSLNYSRKIPLSQQTLQGQQGILQNSTKARKAQSKRMKKYWAARKKTGTMAISKKIEYVYLYKNTAFKNKEDILKLLDIQKIEVI